MLTRLRKWTREQPLSSVTSCVKRGWCSRRYSLWLLLILLVVCVTIQTFVVRQARDNKLAGLPHLRYTVNKQHLLPTLQNARVPLRSLSPAAIKPNMDMDRAAESYYNQQRHRDKIGNLLTSSQRAARNVSEEPSLGHSGSLVLSPTTTSTPALSSFQKADINTKATCRRKSHIVFLKTHKTASSTILNILYRYGENRNLTFALPLNRHSQLFYPFAFASHFVEGVSSRRVKEFHIMCNHMRFRKSEVAKVMPEDTFYFSILRNPVAMMESIFMYYRSIPAFCKTYSLDDFLDNSGRHYNSSVTNNHYAHNILAFDFGLDNNVPDDAVEQEAIKAIAAIEQDFHLILISEYFDESLILLKHALCWSLDDVVSFKLNSRSDTTRHQLLPNTAEKIKSWNALDWRIYRHFNTTFWHKIKSVVGERQMDMEVSLLRMLQDKLAKRCLKDGRAVDPSLIKDAGFKPFQYGAAVIQGYNLNPNIDAPTKTKCQRLITPELQYTDILYTKQFGGLTAKMGQVAEHVSPRRRRSGKNTMMGTVWAGKVRHKYNFSNLKNRKTSTAALFKHTDANSRGMPQV